MCVNFARLDSLVHRDTSAILVICSALVPLVHCADYSSNCTVSYALEEIIDLQLATVYQLCPVRLLIVSTLIPDG